MVPSFSCLFLFVSALTIPHVPIADSVLHPAPLIHDITSFHLPATSTVSRKRLRSSSPSSPEHLLEQDVKVLRRSPRIAIAEPPVPEKQTSFKTDFNQDFDIQGGVGACHIFATLEVIYQTTGLKLSKEKLFLDHLFSLNGVMPQSVDAAIDLNLKEIQRLRSKPGPKPKYCNSISWEGGILKLTK